MAASIMRPRSGRHQERGHLHQPSLAWRDGSPSATTPPDDGEDNGWRIQDGIGNQAESSAQCDNDGGRQRDGNADVAKRARKKLEENNPEHPNCQYQPAAHGLRPSLRRSEFAQANVRLCRGHSNRCGAAATPTLP